MEFALLVQLELYQKTQSLPELLGGVHLGLYSRCSNPLREWQIFASWWKTSSLPRWRAAKKKGKSYL
ncbi:MAG: hypothetical protein GDA36_03540 [Rhodobacteraceae bacterium]|nr:hypothetical protein [Paracoccaceae bacterium]